MLPGGRSRHINYASHRLDWYLQLGSLCDFTSPGSGSVYEVLSLKDAVWRSHLPGISNPFSAGKGSLQVHYSTPLLCLPQVGKSHAMRVDYTVHGSKGCASDAGGIKCNDALGLLNGKNLHRGPNASSDRKSTRLNSSHQIISYAFFYLNKTTYYSL